MPNIRLVPHPVHRGLVSAGKAKKAAEEMAQAKQKPIRILWPSQKARHADDAAAVEHMKLKAGESPKAPTLNGHKAAAVKSKPTWKIGDPVPAKRWTALSHVVFKSAEVKALSHADKHLLMCMLVQLDGYKENGDLKCSFAYMKKEFGWGSPNKLHEARTNLQTAKLLIQTHEGYKGRAARYALTNCLVPKQKEPDK